MSSKSTLQPSPLFSGLLILGTSLAIIVSAVWCSTDGARERAAMIRDLEKISHFESEGQVPADSLKKMAHTQTSAGE